MKRKSYSPTQTDAWTKLQSQATLVKNLSIVSLFDTDVARASTYSLDAGELFLDYSKNLVSDEVWQLLLNLAEQSPLQDHRTAMFAGEAINTTENRAVLHAALRAEPVDACSKDERQRINLVKQ